MFQAIGLETAVIHNLAIIIFLGGENESILVRIPPNPDQRLSYYIL
jgi:hypothetical protein